jgi:hypothetical protein
MADLDLSTKNIAIISSVRLRIMTPAISSPFQFIQRRYGMWPFDATKPMQLIKYLITFGYIKSEFQFPLLIFMSWLQRVTRIKFSSRWLDKLSSINIIRLIVRTIIINMTNIAVSWSKVMFGLFALALLSWSLLSQLSKSNKSMTI